MVIRKRVSLLLLSLFIPLVHAVQVVETTPPAQQQSSSWLNVFSFLKNPIFWYVLIGAVLIMALVIGLFYLVKWLVKFIRRQNDIFYLLKTQRIQLAKVHRRYEAKHWWHVDRNTPIRLARRDDNGKLTISRPLAYHRGDYMTHEGNLIVALNLEGKKKYWFFPETDVLVIPNKEKISIKQRDERGEKKEDITFTLPLAKDIIQFNEGEILIFAESFSRVGTGTTEFLIPVLKTKDGKIVDLSTPIYASLKDVVLGDYLYTQTSDFGNLAKQAMTINPSVRALAKVGDTNQSVEVPSTT